MMKTKVIIEGNRFRSTAEFVVGTNTFRTRYEGLLPKKGVLDVHATAAYAWKLNRERLAEEVQKAAKEIIKLTEFLDSANQILTQTEGLPIPEPVIRKLPDPKPD